MTGSCTMKACHHEATHEVFWPGWKKKAEKYEASNGFVPYCIHHANDRASVWRTTHTMRSLIFDAESVTWDD